jgi:hypothetical protein
LVPLVSPRYSLLPLVFILTQFYPILVPVAHKYAWTPSPSTFTCLTGRAHCEKIPTPLDRNHARARALNRPPPRNRARAAAHPPRPPRRARVCGFGLSSRPARPACLLVLLAKPIFLVLVSSARPELASVLSSLSFPAPTSLLCPCMRAFPAPISNAGAQLLCSAGARLRPLFSAPARVSSARLRARAPVAASLVCASARVASSWKEKPVQPSVLLA